MISASVQDATAHRMQVWEVTGEGPEGDRLRESTRPVPTPAAGEVLVRVEACGVCRTDLHVTDGDLPTHRPRVVPGHEVVGRVVAAGPGASRFDLGDRVGIAWLRHTCGHCRWCRSGAENLCPDARFTGWDADGGYAEFALAPAAFAYRVPRAMASVDVAPLLCAGIIGYRALRRAALPPGGRLGIYGFGASGHLTAQLALAQGAEVHVLTRGREARDLALAVGASSAGDARDHPPVLLDSAIVFAPAGDLVPLALEALERSGTLALAGIHMSDIPAMDYERHLFLERTVTTVTANTRADGESLLRLAGALGVRPRVTTYPFAGAATALADLADGRVTGVAVLDMSSGTG